MIRARILAAALAAVALLAGANAAHAQTKTAATVEGGRAALLQPGQLLGDASGHLYLLPSGTLTPGHCLEIVDGHTVEDAGAACGSGSGGGVTSFNTRTGAVTLQGADVSAAGGLMQASNLADLVSAATARTNLGLGDFATQNYETPPAIGGTTPNSGHFTDGDFSGDVNLSGACGLILPGTGLGLSGSGNSLYVGNGTCHSQSATILANGVDVVGVTTQGITDTSMAGGGVLCLQVDNSGVFGTAAAACGAGAGTVTTTGTPAAGELAKFSGPAAITNGDLSGDCSTSGALVTVCLKLNGVSPGAFFAGTDAANLTGTVALARLPSIGSGDLLGNATSGSAAPADTTLTALIDRAMGSTRGAILERSATGWGPIVPSSTVGFVFASNGTGADPGYQAPAAAGVSSVASGTCLTGGPITSTGTLNFDKTCPLAQNTRTTSYTLALTDANGEVTLNASGACVLTIPPHSSVAFALVTPIRTDDIGTAACTLTRGAGVTLYIDGSTVSQDVVIPPGSGGSLIQILTDTWKLIGFTTLKVAAPQGRLTLSTGVPVMTANVTAAATLYYDSSVGNQVPVYSGSADIALAIGSGEISNVLKSSGTGAENSADVFDDFAVNVSGVLTLCVATNGSGAGWSGDTGGSVTSRGSGYSQLENVRGYWTNKNSITHCYNGATDEGAIGADQATYLGSHYTTAAGQTGMNFKPVSASGGGNPILGLFNAYNRHPVFCESADNAVNWSYNTATWRAADNSASNRCTFIDGLAQIAVSGEATVANFQSASGGRPLNGLDEDSTSGAPFVINQQEIAALGSATAQGAMTDSFLPLMGLHYIQAVERGNGTGTVTWFGLSMVVNLDD